MEPFYEGYGNYKINRFVYYIIILPVYYFPKLHHLLCYHLKGPTVIESVPIALSFAYSPVPYCQPEVLS